MATIVALIINQDVFAVSRIPKKLLIDFFYRKMLKFVFQIYATISWQSSHLNTRYPNTKLGIQICLKIEWYFKLDHWTSFVQESNIFCIINS